jgi:exopolysaccharide biosynthesis polyprenyl glycosylphosphotransferase
MHAKKSNSWLKHTDFILLDLICLHIAFVLAYITRHGLANPYANEDYLHLAMVYTVVNILVLIANRTMKDVLKRGFYKEMAKTVWHVVLVALIVALYMFSVQVGVVYSRITFYLTLGYYLLITYGIRVLWKLVLLRRMRGVCHKAIYFVTTEDRAEYIIRRFQMNSLGGTAIQGLCIVDQDCTGQTIAGVPVTASDKTLLKHLGEIWVDEVFVSLPQDYPTKLTSKMVEMGIVVRMEMALLEGDFWKHQVIEEFGGTTVRTVSMNMATPLQAALKRAMDIVGGLIGCVLTGLLTLIIGPIIFIKSPGPIFFKQTRVGKNGRKFKLYKFRSMYLDAEARKAELMAQNRVRGGLMFKLEYDPRIIGSKKLPDGTVKKGIGNFIRDYSLDEFPQFFNVLKGDLSLCGTRPPTVDEWEHYELHHHARLAIKPGITGMWQVSGRSNITDFEQVVELDKKYIREWSMGLDFRILLHTFKAVLKKDGSM